jgi:hypothetical protein
LSLLLLLLLLCLPQLVLVLALVLVLVQSSSKAVQWMLEVGSFYRNYSIMTTTQQQDE